MSSVAENRAHFLAALRSGEYVKGPFVPLQSAPPAGAVGYCAIGLPAQLFGIYTNITKEFYKQLGLRQRDLSQIQNEWNDSSLTFPQIADLIDYFIFEGVGDASNESAQP